MKRLFFLITLVFLLASCQKESALPMNPDDLKLENDKGLIAKLGFDISDLYELDEFYVVEGDILLWKDSLNAYFPSITRQYGKGLYNSSLVVSQENVKNITIFIDPEVPSTGLFTDWKTAVQQAVEEWNNVPGSTVNMRIVNNESTADIKVSMIEGGTEYVAFAMYPLFEKPGQFIHINRNGGQYLSEERKHTMIHELGHTIGLMHTDYNRGLTSDSGVHYLIPGTPASNAGNNYNPDPNSVMNKVITAWIGFSYHDVAAIQYLYPDMENRVRMNVLMADNGVFDNTWGEDCTAHVTLVGEYNSYALDYRAYDPKYGGRKLNCVKQD